MSKFKNKKALALSVGAIMAGVSVIGVVAACAPTKAKPAKPTEKKVEQPQTGGNESSNPGSGSTTNPSGQGSNNGGTTNPSGGSTNTTPGATQPANPGSQGTKNNPTTPPTNSSTPETTPKDPKTQGNKPSVGSGTESGSKDKTEQTPPTTEQNPKVIESPKENGSGAENKGESTEKEQGGKSGDGSQSGEDNKQQSEEEKLKAQQEAEAKKKAEADAKALAEKKTAVVAEIENLTDIPTERITKYKGDVDKIVDPSESDKLTKILNDAKKEDEDYRKLEAKKDQAKQEINDLKNIKDEEKNKLLEQLEKINDISKINDIDSILETARKQEATVIASKLEIIPIDGNSLERKADQIIKQKYLYFRIKTSVANYEKIKEKQFVMLVDKDNKFILEEPSTTFKAGNKTIYHENAVTADGFVTFTISSTQAYNDSEKGTYKVAQLYLAGDTAKKNILKGQSNTITI